MAISSPQDLAKGAFLLNLMVMRRDKIMPTKI